MPLTTGYNICPLGDSALVVNFANTISEPVNRLVLATARQLSAALEPSCEVVPSYSSLTIHYDPVGIRKVHAGTTAYTLMRGRVEAILASPAIDSSEGRLVTIPVCYEEEFAPDMLRLTQYAGLNAAEIIGLHQSTVYRVYMLGFLPGFCYLGEVNERIAIPRKPRPEQVPAGSIGIAGRQTGVYPLPSPGGWHIIGRTPMSLFRPANSDPTLLQPGDRVRFEAISAAAFIEYQQPDAGKNDTD